MEFWFIIASSLLHSCSIPCLKINSDVDEMEVWDSYTTNGGECQLAEMMHDCIVLLTGHSGFTLHKISSHLILNSSFVNKIIYLCWYNSTVIALWLVLHHTGDICYCAAQSFLKLTLPQVEMHVNRR